MTQFNWKNGLFLMGFLCISAGVSAQTNSVTNNELKQNARPLTNSLSYLERLEPISFEYDKNQANKLKLPAGEQYGFNAEDVQKVLPGIVKSQKKMVPAGKNAFKTTEIKDVEMESLIAILVASVKEQQAEIERLKADLQSLKSMTSK
ncbi:tail fiber domain-containing protein [Arcticibacter sp.]|uniref:tail fiber domain-containing protein n=1 Tax=Arcticibacter sp. TaxID=1872630 RepID=UPI00388EB082